MNERLTDRGRSLRSSNTSLERKISEIREQRRIENNRLLRIRVEGNRKLNEIDGEKHREEERERVTNIRAEQEVERFAEKQREVRPMQIQLQKRRRECLVDVELNQIDCAQRTKIWKNKKRYLRLYNVKNMLRKKVRDDRRTRVRRQKALKEKVIKLNERADVLRRKVSELKQKMVDSGQTVHFVEVEAPVFSESLQNSGGIDQFSSKITSMLYRSFGATDTSRIILSGTLFESEHGFLVNGTIVHKPTYWYLSGIPICKWRDGLPLVLTVSAPKDVVIRTANVFVRRTVPSESMHMIAHNLTCFVVDTGTVSFKAEAYVSKRMARMAYEFETRNDDFSQKFLPMVLQLKLADDDVVLLPFYRCDDGVQILERNGMWEKVVLCSNGEQRVYLTMR